MSLPGGIALIKERAEVMLEGDMEKRECEGETPKIGQRRRQLTPVWQLWTLTYCTDPLEV